MTRTVTALFDHYDDAAKVVQRLEDAGISYRDISIVSNAAGNRHITPLGTTDDAVAGAGAGAAVGTALGGGAGILAGLGLVTIPGLGPAIAAGWLAAAAAGAAAGAATGGLVGSLVGAGVRDEDAHVYSEGLRRGGTLVIARIDDGQYEDARAILDQSRAVDIAARTKAYRASGWSRFNEAAGPLAADEIARQRSLYGVTAQHSANPLIASGRVEGTGVYDSNGTYIGAVKRLMIDKVTGRVAYVEMSFGGFLGLVEDTHIIPWDALTYDTHMQGYRTSITEDQVRGAPAFYRDPNWDWSNRERERELHDHYGVRYYWGS
jgi:PRC-barrel domain